VSAFIEPVFVPDDSFDLNRDEPVSDICTVRSGTNFGFGAAAEVLVVCSRSGALSDDLAADLDVAVLVAEGPVFFLVLDEDRRLLIKIKIRIPAIIAMRRRTTTPAIIPIRIFFFRSSFCYCSIQIFYITII